MNKDEASLDINRWKKLAGESSRAVRLNERQRMIAAIREDLYGEGFLEVETPLLVKTTCPDTYIDSVQADEGYLITSTEYQIKRMMVGGFEKVFTLTKNFRANDRGRYHSSEFTMLEWARTNVSLQAIKEDATRFIRKAFSKVYPDKNSLIFNGHEIEILKNDWEKLTVQEAFKRHLGLSDLEDYSLDILLKRSKEANIEIPSNFQHDKHLVISYLLDLLQSHLGKKTPTFLEKWPSYLSSSAPIENEGNAVADRVELYIGGIEIANGFPFLRDAKVQRELFNEALEARKTLGKPTVKIDERYLQGLEEGLPPGAGMALGIDRLIMVLTGSSKLSDVQAFSWDEL